MRRLVARWLGGLGARIDDRPVPWAAVPAVLCVIAGFGLVTIRIGEGDCANYCAIALNIFVFPLPRPTLLACLGVAGAGFCGPE